MSRKDFLFFFLGVDPAPSEAKRSDDGALMTACAHPRRLPENGEGLSDNPADWYFDFVHGRRLSSKEKASARQYSGIIHTQHRAFRYEKIMMDPNGGGTFVKRELILADQLINGIKTEVTPISDMVDGPMQVVRADFILHMYKRGDPGIDALWGAMQGDDNLNDNLYAQFKDDLDHTLIGWPDRIDEWLIDPERKKEVLSWIPEKRWALQTLSTSTKQFENINVATKEDGTYFFTRHGARQFSAVGKKDFVSAGMYARLAFLVWLRSDEWRTSTAPEDESTCGS